MECKICNNETYKIFNCLLLGKYDVGYYSCNNCDFIQTEEPYWLDEAYSLGAISALDVGIMSRNLLLTNKTEIILKKLFTDFTMFSGIDYGGGEGIFVRLMRDKGFNFYRQDLYAENLYARYFDIKDLPDTHKFNILTAFEVLEHLSNPIEDLTKMFLYSDIILFSTELQPSNDSVIKDWWYLVPETGQHISFYTVKTFKEIARNLKAYYYTDSINLHILSKELLPINPFHEKRRIKTKKSDLQKIVNKIKNRLYPNRSFKSKDLFPKSLIMADFEKVKKKLQK